MRIITYGTWDLFHEGHKHFLERAAAMGTYLIVGVSTDEFTMTKGKPKPINDYWTRVEHVKPFADLVISECSWSQKKFDIKHFKPDLLVMGDDWATSARFTVDLGCPIHFLPRTPGISSTELRRQYK